MKGIFLEEKAFETKGCICEETALTATIGRGGTFYKSVEKLGVEFRNFYDQKKYVLNVVCLLLPTSAPKSFRK